MNNKKFNIEEIYKIITEFRKKRDWEKFHNPKNLAISISLEANELLEHFQWKDLEESLEYSKNNKNEISSEIADILTYVLYLCNDLSIDISEVIKKKIKENAKKYPVSKSKGNSKKYNQFK